MLVLNCEEERLVIGGTDQLRIKGGYLEEKDGGTYFYGDDGSSVFFKDVGFYTSLVANGDDYQWIEVICVSGNWANSGFSVYDFAHEYGHYLQQEDMGTGKYLVNIAIPSVYSASTDPYNHSSQSYEQDATNRGEEYLNNNWNNWNN